MNLESEILNLTEDLQKVERKFELLFDYLLHKADNDSDIAMILVERMDKLEAKGKK